MEFRTSQLLRYIGLHLLSLGVRDGRPDGKAHGALWIEDEKLSFQDPVHFTEGLSHLSVMPVAARHVPMPRKHLVFRVKTMRLDYHDTRDANDILAAADGPQSQDDEQYWVRASTSSADGQVVISIYIQITLQAHAPRDSNVAVYSGADRLRPRQHGRTGSQEPVRPDGRGNSNDCAAVRDGSAKNS
jgi:hypothetical protein